MKFEKMINRKCFFGTFTSNTPDAYNLIKNIKIEY